MKSARKGRFARRTGSPESSWVSCSERMPDDGQRCRVRDRKGNMTVGIYVCEGGLSGWMLEMRPEDWGSWPKCPPITHWRAVNLPPNAELSDGAGEKR